MELNDVQKKAIAQWVAEGRSIGEIQKLLAEQFSLSMLYMDVRFLLIDLGLNVKDKQSKPSPKAAILAPDAAEEPDLEAEPMPAGALGKGGSVELDRITRPGAVVSGTAVFSDGVKANWMLDQMGRLALDAGAQKNYRPTPEDVQSFQMEITKLLKKQGY
jgi:hypothetical protein